MNFLRRTIINHNDVMNDIKAMLEDAEPPITGECCIYRVPYDIRSLNEDAYTPKVVSIGPFHHGHPRLQNMERVKLLCCKRFLQRVEVSLDSLIHHIVENEQRVRRCYSDTLDLNKEELVKVISVDSCFIFELFYNETSVASAFFLKPWLTANIQMDLLLLENQIPFFILESLFNLASISGIRSFLEFTFKYFRDYNRSNIGNDEICSISHFTDLLRTFQLQPLGRRPHRTDDREILTHLQSATELVEAGMRLKVNTENKCLLDLRFSGQVLEIPQFTVEDNTETLFRNLVALEQCHYPDKSYITDYVDVLDFLINTSRDVDVLVKMGILVNWLGDTDSAANLFNGLMKNITLVNSNTDYLRLREDLNDFCKNPWHNLKATLRRDYGNTPWKAAASIAGIVLLILTLVQSVCSVLQVVMQ